MSEEHKYRYKIFREALIALLLSVLLGLGAAITLGLWWGLATATGLTATIILLAYKALANISAKARVAMLALQTLGTGFTVAIAAQPLRNWLATIAAEWLNKQGLSLANLPDPIEPLPLFAILAATATVCTIGYFIFDDGAKKTDISESAASPNIHTSLDTGATDDRVALGLPSPKTVLVASIVYLAGILGVGLYIHYNVIANLSSGRWAGPIFSSLGMYFLLV